MPGFADSFWSSDYAGGLGVLFGKLQQGVMENQQVLTVARMRAEAEELYGARLGDIGPAADRFAGGFARDDGASVRKAYDGVRGEMEEGAKKHRKIGSNIRELVVSPFGRWCEAHEARVQRSQDDLQARIKAHDRQAEQVRKLRSHYFNKCRLVEDLEEENKLAFQDPQSESSPKAPQLAVPVPEVRLPEHGDSDDEEPVEIGDETYLPEQVKKILRHMLDTLRLGEARVPILGTYQNVSTGAELVEYFQAHMHASTVSYAERIGQDLIGHGFLRLVGSVGNTFANSSKMNYQWRPKAFQLTGVPERRKTLPRTATLPGVDLPDSPAIGAVGDYLAGWNPLNNQHPNETPADRLRREAGEADERYKAGVRKLDLLRCDLEESMMDQLRFMEKCELDRLRAIKAVILDFSGAIGNVIPSLQSTVDNMMLYQETVQPAGDLRYLLENYRTGGFVPRVQVYENYYNSADEQTFGVDLEARARADRKRVPVAVTTILTFLDNHYPDMEGDDARRIIWLVDVPLAATHHLRSAINNGGPVPTELLERYEIPIVASVLKLYLLELPDSLVSSHVYEIIKTIYSTQASESDEATRVSVIQNTLGQLRLANIATLDAIATHFTRLIELTSADEEYVAALASSLAPCILRPRTESTLTSQERYSYRLVRDLFAHKDAIFGELKRASSAAAAIHAGGRPRGATSNESNRRAHMEERAHAIASRSRASSPAPGASRGGHRRDRSIGSAATRFPIQTSPTASASKDRKVTRQSLEVPGSNDTSPVVAADVSQPFDPSANGSADATGAHRPADDDVPATARDGGGVRDRVHSIDRGAGAGPPPSARFSKPLPAAHRARPSVASAGGGKPDGAASRMSEIEVEEAEAARPRGISLSDKPMDD
ncbi:MAG: hypothetical protein M1832_004079 [Thelocarpon impressellum]|nr:MAG: hypothetical protein M1832_004079 [Thelocarpon impressellum]